MRTVNIHEAKTHLSRLVERAAQGEPFVIAKAGKALVKVMPLAAAVTEMYPWEPPRTRPAESTAPSPALNQPMRGHAPSITISAKAKATAKSEKILRARNDLKTWPKRTCAPPIIITRSDGPHGMTARQNVEF